MSEITRFWAKVDEQADPPEFRPDLDPCWLWTGGLTVSGGYAQFYASRQARTVRAHRFAYEMFVGPIPDGLVLDHLCRVSRCVNPNHLEIVTRRENCRRGIKGVLTTHCPHGHEYTPENTYYSPSRGLWRGCKACRKRHNDKNNARAKERRRCA